MSIKIPSSNIYDVSSENYNTSGVVRQCSIASNSQNEQSGNILETTYAVRVYDAREQSDETFTFDFVANDTDINAFPFYKITIPNTSSGWESIQGHIKLKPNKPFLLYIDEYNEDIGIYAYLTLKILCHYQDVTGKQQTKEILVDRNYIWKEHIDEGYETDLQYNADTQTFERTNLLSSKIKGRINGESSEWYLTSAEFQLLGIYFEQYTVDVTIGDETSPQGFSFPTNELVRTDTTYQGQDHNNFLATEVINKHKGGKEVYTIKCSVGKYYDTDGFLALYPENSSYPAVFVKYDIVEPYVFTLRGEVPLSTKADGTAKQFEVIGVDFSYKGVVWQELTLQEYVE